jgi:hypothetical protein
MDFGISILQVCYFKGVIPFKLLVADKAQVAQLVEHVLGKDEVTGSIPVLGL